MGITPRFNSKDTLKTLQKGYLTIERGILAVMQRTGEEFATDAKDNLKIDPSFHQGDYKDQTGNLRSSIGYFVLKDGAIISQKFSGNQEGIIEAVSVLGEIPNKQGYQLVGVAGMVYASSVESKGYNVMSSQKEVALIDLNDRLRKFAERMNKKGVDVGFNLDDLAVS